MNQAIVGFAAMSLNGVAVGQAGGLLLLNSAAATLYVVSDFKDQQEAQAAIGQVTTTSETRNGALREAKRANGVPVSAQPDKVILPGTPEGERLGLRPGDNVRLYEYTNANGQKVWIREDRAVAYPDGGRQGSHFNSGPAGGPRGQRSLTNHHFFRRR
jgi:hypothetical protein